MGQTQVVLFFFTANKIEGAVLCTERMIMANIRSLPAACTDCSSHCPPRRVHPGTHSVGNHCSVTFQHKHSLQKTVQCIRSSCALLVLKGSIRTINSSFGEGKVNATTLERRGTILWRIGTIIPDQASISKNEQKQATRRKHLGMKTRKLRLLWPY